MTRKKQKTPSSSSPSSPRHRRSEPENHKSNRLSSALPPVLVAKVTGLSTEGELLAEPVKWLAAHVVKPVIFLTSGATATVGDAVLVKIHRPSSSSDGQDRRARKKSGNTSPAPLHGQVLKVLPAALRQSVLGVCEAHPGGALLEPVSRKQKQRYFIPHEYLADATSGQLVLAETTPHARHATLGLPEVKIVEILGRAEDPRCYSLIAIHHNEIPTDFSEAALLQAAQAEDPVLSPDRADLRAIPLITIDGPDARDFDDAVFAQPAGAQNGTAGSEGIAENEETEGWHLLVAIAEVAHYVPADSPLDQEAANRGNSTYFPDRVVPMLPEALSNGLCSLNPGVDRYCLAVHLHIDTAGNLLDYRFERGLMRSHARLTYQECQDLSASALSETDACPALRPHLKHLYAAFHCLLQARQRRGALDLDLPEFYTLIGADGHIESVQRRERLDSHRLIEEFMVTANIAAARFLEKHRLPGLYRIHEPPTTEKTEELRLLLKSLGHKFSDTPTPQDFNRLLQKSAGTEQSALINSAVLRSQMQACYLPQNRGHFGLGLTHYAHFTSPIRRYADLVVHRAIIEKLCNTQSITDTADATLAAIASHISQTERRSMLAEREANDRYLAAYMASHGQAEFSGTVTGIGSFGLFVTLNETGASGLVSIRNLGKDYYVYDEGQHTLIGQRSGERFQLGQRVKVAISQADLQLGSLAFALVESTALPPTGKPVKQPPHPRGKFRRKSGKKPRKKTK